MPSDPDEILAELEKIPGFRAQKIAAKGVGVDVEGRIARGLAEVDAILQEMGQVYFQRYADQTEAPYGIYLFYDVRSCTHEVTLQIGNTAMMAVNGRAFARIKSGQLKREVVK